MGKPISPLLGFNNNVKHKGRLFHVQTEDSGVKHPHILTHLFADGGRIVHSSRTDYTEHIDSDDLTKIVRRMMKDQHKAMFIALRDGSLDDLVEGKPGAVVRGKAPPPPKSEMQAADNPTQKIADSGGEHRRGTPALGTPAATQSSPPADGSEATYAAPRPAAIFQPAESQQSIFGQPPQESAPTLDDVVLSYISEDSD